MDNAEKEILINYQIAQLVSRYNMSWDEGRFADVSMCFTEEGIFVDSYDNPHRGREAIEAFAIKSLELFGRMRHVTANHVVYEHDGVWKHQCYLIFVSGIGTADKQLVSGHYDDDFVVGSEGPLFSVRRVFLDS